MAAGKIPHPVPYQGSKRNLASTIASHIPKKVAIFFEPFAGSAAMTLYAAHHGFANRFVIGDALEPIVDLWRAIVESPDDTAKRYRDVWSGQQDSNTGYFNIVRDRFNSDRDPVDLLYIVCRCVKNAVRFNGRGGFSQSPDKRRLGMHPDKMAIAIRGASHLLKGKTEFRVGDWLETLADATVNDLIYMDPPYQGTSVGRDKRYHSQITVETLIDGLSQLNERGLMYALSYDGMTGGRAYGEPLPADLQLKHIHLHAGRSSQATLLGQDVDTVESLYLSEAIEVGVFSSILERNSSSPRKRIGASFSLSPRLRCDQ